jgi:mannose/cellobiose epimerase-like protein (N-acyl-D-glucosamine 2-epimerase family)
VHALYEANHINNLIVMLKKVSVIIICSIAFANVVVAQTVNYKERIQIIYKNIGKYFTDEKNGLYYETTDAAHNENPNSWLWPICGLIQAANEMEVIEPQKTYMLPVDKAIEKYSNPLPPIPGYQDYVYKEKVTTRYYDDNQWLGIAWIDAYNRTKKVVYLEKAKQIYQFMMTGHDTITGGGIYWREKDKTTKNTCSNGPGIVLALQLYKTTKEKHYLQSGLALYEWTNKHLQSPEGIYYDAIKIPDLRIDKAFYTYNTGTMLQSNVLLYNITKDEKYLSEARRVAAAGKKHFFKNGRLPFDPWFNAVMLRGYIDLYKVDKNKEWIQFFVDDANKVWQEDSDANHLIGKKPYKKLIEQVGMLEIYARLAVLK